MEENRVTYFKTLNKIDCNGCGACSLVCPVHCLKMEKDEEGFLYPVKDESKCIHCGKCEKACSNFNDKKEENEKAYIAINKNIEDLNKSSSGGMYLILAKYVVEQKGVIFGVTYDKDLNVIHSYAENEKGIYKFCGSKYVRSDLKDSYQKAQEFLNQDRLVLFTGTACQISGLKHYLNKEYENLITCDILCHANPSPLVFDIYKRNLEKKYNKKIVNFKFRAKETGWRNQYPLVEFENGEKVEEEEFFKIFISEIINRPSCYFCKFASMRRITDFTIGDLWGIEKIDPSVDETNGVSLLTVNSEKGSKIFDKIKDKIDYKETDYKLVASYNHYQNVQIPSKREKFFKEVKSEKINDDNIIYKIRKYTKVPMYTKIFEKGKRMIKKIFEILNNVK